LFVFGRRFAERVTDNQPPGIGADRFVEKNGVVVEDINNRAGKGRIIVDSDEWRALSENGEIIKKDTVVQVIRIDGTKTVVKPLEKEE
jgi:membrane protein implicated in regulation of membrane protease activity